MAAPPAEKRLAGNPFRAEVNFPGEIARSAHGYFHGKAVWYDKHESCPAEIPSVRLASAVEMRAVRL